MKRLLLPLIVLAALTSLGRLSPAATLLVTDPGDSGAGTLREAIASANAGDTINFNVTSPIILTSGELLIDKNLTLAGPGPALLTVQRDPGAGDFRIFKVTASPVAISGLTIRNGRAVTGGGILNQGTLTLTDCVISNNTATGGQGFGGAGGGIHNDRADLHLRGVVVTGNAAIGGVEEGLGGGIYTQGTMTMNASLCADNLATGAAGASGGAMFSLGTTEVTATTFTNNSAAAAAGATAQGGAIYTEGLASLADCSIGGNQALGGSDGSGDGGPAFGGGLAGEWGAAVFLSRSTLSGNLAAGGNAGGGTNGAASGGGMHAGFGVTAFITNCTLSGNLAIEGQGGTAAFSVGGGISMQFSTVYLFNSTVVHNTVTGSSAEDGAGLHASEATLECQNSIVAANTGTYDLFASESAAYYSYGHNLVGSVKVPSGGSTGPGTADQFNVSPAALQLGPLHDNGGPTLTHALLCGSLAINSGDNTGAPPTDQRGLARVIGVTIDVGAYESAGSGSGLTLTGCPANQNLGCNPSSIPTCDPSDVTVTGGCGTPGVTCVYHDSVSGCEYTRLIIYTATDGAGSEAKCSRTITWTEDRTAPVFTRWPSDRNLGVNPPSGSIPGCDPSAVEATTDCGLATIITCSSSDSGSACARTRTIIYTATSRCGNTASYTQKITWTVLAPGDLNSDGCVDLKDYNLIMAQIRAKSTNLTYDLNGDKRVTIADARSVVVLFTNPGGAPCTP